MLDGTYTYTDESGVTQLIDTNASSNPYDNTTSGLTATDVQAAIDEINALAGTVALVDNGDGTYDFTDAAGNTTIITDTSISTMVDNLMVPIPIQMNQALLRLLIPMRAVTHMTIQHLA